MNTPIVLCDLDLLAEKIAEKLAQRMGGGLSQQKLYTIEELAERYCTSGDTIRRRVKAGEFGEVVRLGKRGMRVTGEGVLLYDSTHTQPAHQAPERRLLRKRTARENPGPI